jgi:hypothetical protein
VADLGKARAGDQSDIAGTDDANIHTSGMARESGALAIFALGAFTLRIKV